jgi:hypothetical protein
MATAHLATRTVGIFFIVKSDDALLSVLLAEPPLCFLETIGVHGNPNADGVWLRLPHDCLIRPKRRIHAYRCWS